MKNESILSVKDLSVSFHMYEKGLEQYDLKVISNMTLDVRPGEIVAIAGSSGSGKSLLAHAVMGLLPENAAIGGDCSPFISRYSSMVCAGASFRSTVLSLFRR